MLTQEILEKLECVSGRYPQYMARCPAHNDNRPSLSIRDETDRTLIYCFARLQCRRNYEFNRFKIKRPIQKFLEGGTKYGTRKEKSRKGFK